MGKITDSSPGFGRVFHVRKLSHRSRYYISKKTDRKRGRKHEKWNEISKVKGFRDSTAETEIHDRR